MTVLDLKKLIEHKKEGYYPSSLHFDLKVKPKEHAEIKATVPTNKAYIFTKGVHDIEADIFTHKYLKDGKLVLPETLISGDLMEYIFTEPFITINEVHGYITNTHWRFIHRFSLTLYMMVCEIEKLEKEIW